MPEFMVWQMAGPMASWGNLAAVGEKRLTDSGPTRSALIGMLASCLGIKRRDEDNLMALSESLGVASAVLSDPVSGKEGEALRDFHTIQTAAPRGKKGQINVSRADELTDPGSTILSERYYLTGGMFLGCVWVRSSRSSPLVPLQALADALIRPGFAPYLGRRCCPAGLPFAPSIIDASGCDAAMRAYLMDGRAAAVLGSAPVILRMSWDLDAPGGKPRADQLVRRRDLTVSFQRRQYIERGEGVTFAANDPDMDTRTDGEIFDDVL